MIHRQRMLQSAVFIAGILCLAAGIATGQAGTTLMKAVNICLECIGIG